MIILILWLEKPNTKLKYNYKKLLIATYTRVVALYWDSDSKICVSILKPLLCFTIAGVYGDIWY